MTIRLSSTVALLWLVFSVFPALALSPVQSPWVGGLHSRIRLISGGKTDGQWLAGIQIALDSGFKTYWRNPGDSGLPPRFDWTGSENVAAIEIKWPAPARQEDAGGVAYVYHDTVVLPLLIRPTDPAQPVNLKLSIDYGVCKDICIPAQADIALELMGPGAKRSLLETTVANLPRLQALGTDAPLSVLGLESTKDNRKSFNVTVRAPAGTQPALFAEGPENWYLSTSLPDAENRFVVTVEERPKDAKGSVPVRLTLVAGDTAIETEVMLNGDGQPQ